MAARTKVKDSVFGQSAANASADSLLFVKYPFLFNSFNFPTQLISFYYLFVMLFLSFIRSLAMLVTH